MVDNYFGKNPIQLFTVCKIVDILRLYNCYRLKKNYIIFGYEKSFSPASYL